METLYKIKKFCDENDVKVDIDFYNFLGVRMVMKYNGLCRSLTLNDNELQYNKVDICFVLEEMLEELKKKEEEIGEKSNAEEVVIGDDWICRSQPPYVRLGRRDILVTGVKEAINNELQ